MDQRYADLRFKGIGNQIEQRLMVDLGTVISPLRGVVERK